MGHDIESFSQVIGGHAGQVQGGTDAKASKLGAPARTNTPNISHIDRIQRQSAIGIGFGKLEHTLGGGIFFGNAIGQLGQRLGRRDTNRNGNASPLLDALSNGSAQRLNVQVLQWSKVEKHFIDGINFNVGDKFQNGTHHPSRHVVVQRVIGGPNHHLMTIKPIATLEGGFAHADARIFGFL